MPVPSPAGSGTEAESKTARSANPRRLGRVPCEERYTAFVEWWRIGRSPGMAEDRPADDPARSPVDRGSAARAVRALAGAAVRMDRRGVKEASRKEGRLISAGFGRERTG